MSTAENTRQPPSPLQYLFTQPANLEEGIARASMAMGRMLGYAWKNQQVLEQYVSAAQTGTIALWEELWQNSLEAMYLREPRRLEKIDLS